MKGQLTPIEISWNGPVTGRARDMLSTGGTAAQTFAHATLNLQIL